MEYWRETVLTILGGFATEASRHPLTAFIVVAVNLSLPAVWMRFL